MTRLYPRFAALALAASLAVVTGTLAATATPAYAAENGTRTAAVRVAYDDLNLQSAAGLRRLDARVRAAAERLCNSSGAVALGEQVAAEACADAAIASAAPQVARATQVQPANVIILASGR